MGAFLGACVLAETWIIGFGIYVVLFAGITFVCLRKEMGQVWSQIHKDYKTEGRYLMDPIIQKWYESSPSRLNNHS